MTDKVNITVLVTGAAGGVGQATCKILTDKNFKVKGLIRPEDEVGSLNLSKENIIIGSIENPDLVYAALQDVDVVINCAALLPNALHLGKEAFNRVNVEGALNVLRQAAKRNVKEAIFFSTIGVVNHLTKKIIKSELCQYLEAPSDAYIASKINLEKALKKESESYKGRISIIRPAFIYGPGNYAVWKDALNLLQKGKMVLIGDGNAVLPVIYAEDIARFIMLLIQTTKGSNFGIYILSNPELTTMKQIFNFIADYLGVKRPRNVPLLPLKIAASIVGLLPRIFRIGRLKLLTKVRVLQFSKGYDLSGVINFPPVSFLTQTDYQEGFTKMLDEYKKSISKSDKQ